ncbi:MAG: hypothetical protein QXS85_04845 [Acidilobaceae archaeon]
MSEAREEAVVLSVEIKRSALEKLSKLAERLSTSPERLLSTLADVLSDYSDRLPALGSKLKVADSVRAESVVEELVFYGLVAWEELSEKILGALGASGCYELNDLEFEPLEPYLELEFVALERCELRADVVVVKWAPGESVVEAHYYLEDRPAPQKPVETAYEWHYEPDEHAVVMRASAKSFGALPSIARLDEEAGKLGV